MALDGIYLRHIKNEIEKQSLGARVNQIYQPNRDELVFVLRTYGGSQKLLLSARANSPRVNYCVNTPENPAQPPMFCMLMRKRLGGGKLVGVRQLECDRVLFLDFECVNELGDLVDLSVVCEIMGMYSNIILIDRGTGVIVDALKRVCQVHIRQQVGTWFVRFPIIILNLIQLTSSSRWIYFYNVAHLFCYGVLYFIPFAEFAHNKSWYSCPSYIAR